MLSHSNFCITIPLQPSRPKSHRKEIEDRILRKIGPAMTEEQQKQTRDRLTYAASSG